MARLLLLSNGHGEDLSGALLGKALTRLNHEVDALPLVGVGSPYVDRKIAVLGKTKDFSTGGLGYTSWQGRLTEFFQGQIFYLLKRFWKLILIAHQYDLIIVIGDIVPIIGAWLTNRPIVTYLVAYSTHYEGKLRLPWPCKKLLRNKRFLNIYSRDQLTAEDLSEQLHRRVEFLGNPFMDDVLTPCPRLSEIKYRIGLIPGSRFPELEHNLNLMLSVIELLPEDRFTKNELSLDLALVPKLDNFRLKKLTNQHGWELEETSNHSAEPVLSRGHYRINVRREAFIQILQNSDLLLSMAGTATEQAVGLAKPVVQLPGSGPQFTENFAEAQRRLLGPTVFCADGVPGGKLILRNTAELTMDLIDRIKEDFDLQQRCKRQAKLRLGKGGSGDRIAKAINNQLLLISSNCSGRTERII